MENKTVLVKERLKNPAFWLGVLGVIFSASGVDFNTLTSWSLLGQAFLNILANPVAVVAVAALIGVVVDPSTKGLKDNK
ncbi:phage holin [Clostridium perfringens]|uniref:phage holin n=1 Tax=Clostridium perfringens TaxID=1502 RepID=UPI000DF10296|nr:phage holin [Clostridium perfringens]STB59707.1 Small integral membrane protein [Clostridium perfringens]STB59781.1 Small integral membrane protein [Clostridium perfringens]